MLKFVDSWGRVHGALGPSETSSYSDSQLGAFGPTGVAVELNIHYSDMGITWEELVIDQWGWTLLPEIFQYTS